MVSECFNSSFKQQQHRTNSETMKCEMGKKPKHSSKAMSFIKVLGRDFSKQLQLPEEFTANLNGYVPHRFIIESGLTRKCWRVEVEKDEDGRFFFQDGWADFVEAHSLEVGNFLLFEYEEQSIFQVRIYGRNGFERTILPDSKGGQHKPQTAIDEDDNGEDSEAVENEPVLVKCSQQRTRLAPKKYGQGIWKKKHAVRRPYKRTPLVSAKVSQNNSCFSIKIHHSKKHQFSQLTVPKAVSMKMKLPSKQKLKFQDAQGKCWPVTLGHRRDGRAIFSQGWKELMNDNKVAPGDNLKFEFSSDEIVRFHLTKASKAEHQSDDEATGSLNMDCTPRTPSARRASNPTSNTKPHCESGSSFSMRWRESIARTYLYMPQSVVRAQDLANKESIALRDPEGKCWPLEVKKLSGNRVVLTKGWVEFWKGHGITTGDLLQFNFVSEYLIQVTINRGKPLNEPDVEGAVICLEDAIDNEDVVAIGQEPIITQEEFDAAINQAVLREEFDAAMPFPEN